MMDYEAQERDLVTWFKDDVLADLVATGTFPTKGPNPRITDVAFRITDRFTDHFASSPYFVDLSTTSDAGPDRFHLIVKFPVQDARAREKMHVDRQFLNETRFYNEVIPELRQSLATHADILDDLCPRCYHARLHPSDPTRSLLVFENLRSDNYNPAAAMVFLDLDHCLAAMRAIGRFHAVSLAMKTRDPDSLARIKSAYVEARFFDDPAIREHCDVFLTRCNQRGIDYLLSRDEIPHDYIRKFRSLIQSPYDLMTEMIRPREPLSVLCHGDFCRNNILFRYDDDGRVAGVKLIDFQTFRYGSPSIDLSFFIYLNTSRELREKHFDKLFAAYHESLVRAAAEILERPEGDVVALYPLEAFRADFAEHAVYAYSLVSFFQAVMTSSGSVTWDQTMEEQAEILYREGGDAVSRGIADVIVDYYKRGFYA